MTREMSCGRSPKAMMLVVSRRTGRSTMCQSAAHSTQVTTAAIISEMLRNVRETRHSASISGVSSSVTAMPASSGERRPATWIMVPGLANSVSKASRMLSTNVSLSRLTVSTEASGLARLAGEHAPP